LEAVFVFVDKTFDLDEVILLETVDSILDVVPHFGFDLPGPIPNREGQIGLARFLWFDLFVDDDEGRDDDLVFLLRAVGNEEIFHAPGRAALHHYGRKQLLAPPVYFIALRTSSSFSVFSRQPLWRLFQRISFDSGWRRYQRSPA